MGRKPAGRLHSCQTKQTAERGVLSGTKAAMHNSPGMRNKSLSKQPSLKTHETEAHRQETESRTQEKNENYRHCKQESGFLDLSSLPSANRSL